MKYLLSTFVLSLLLCQNVAAGEITRGVKPEAKKISAGNANFISPTDILETTRPMEQDVQQILNTYSDAQLRQYVVALNKSQILAAKQAKTAVPAKISNSVLQDREKMAEYLRSFYQYKY